MSHIQGNITQSSQVAPPRRVSPNWEKGVAVAPFGGRHPEGLRRPEAAKEEHRKENQIAEEEYS